MSDKSADLVQRLINAEAITPALRSSYQAELETMLHPKFTPRTAVPAILLLMVLAACVIGLVRNMLFHEAAPLVLVGWVVLASSFTWAGALIARDLWLKKHSRKSQFSISRLLSAAAGTITVVALLIGLSKPSDPASTFNAFYVFVFYVACIAWSLDSRIAAAELAAREQMLRIECRLADLAERLQK
jgi:hypothetical protein